MRQAADLIAEVHPTSFRSVARLEEEQDVPIGRRQLTAYIALLAYGYDPDDFGLAGTPASRLVNRTDVARDLANARSRSFSVRSPSAGSGSSPRKSGCFPDNIRLLRLTAPVPVAVAA